jgi:hypothetical protein
VTLFDRTPRDDAEGEAGASASKRPEKQFLSGADDRVCRLLPTPFFAVDERSRLATLKQDKDTKKKASKGRSIDIIRLLISKKKRQQQPFKMTMKKLLIFLLAAVSVQQNAASPHSPDAPLRGGSQAPPKRRPSKRTIIEKSEIQEESESVQDSVFGDKIDGSTVNEAQMKLAAARLRRNSQEDKPVRADFVADTKLPTDVGHFRLRAYRILDHTNEFVGSEPCVIYSADKPPFGSDGELLEGVPVRVHDQCMTSEVFRSQR